MAARLLCTRQAAFSSRYRDRGTSCPSAGVDSRRIHGLLGTTARQPAVEVPPVSAMMPMSALSCDIAIIGPARQPRGGARRPQSHRTPASDRSPMHRHDLRVDRLHALQASNRCGISCARHPSRNSIQRSSQPLKIDGPTVISRVQHKGTLSSKT